MTTADIIVVEDEPKIAQILVDYLGQADFGVTLISEGTDAVETIRANAPDMLILDLMLPGKDGLSICREVRQFSNVPVMMLTAKIDEIDRLIGLELGADDYVCKPFSPREVVARVRTILRRVASPPAPLIDDKLSYQNVVIDLQRYECLVSEHLVELTPVEFKMLAGLMRRPGQVLSRSQLMNLCYSDDRVVSDRTIDTHVKNLRKKLFRSGDDQELIHSIYGVGYKID